MTVNEKQVILTVDDDREIVKVLDKLPELEGYEVHAVYDGITGMVFFFLMDTEFPVAETLSDMFILQADCC